MASTTPGAGRAPSSTAAATSTAGTPTGTAAGVDYTSPLAVARSYVSTRWTFQPDAASYVRALTARDVSTPDFAARSAPDPAEAARMLTAHDASTVAVTSAVTAPEAPNTPTTVFSTVAFTTTETYDGAGSGQLQDHEWSLRLVNTAAASGPPARWLVDAVVIGDE